MKKILNGVVALALAVSMCTGCSENSNNKNTNSSKTTESEVAFSSLIPEPKEVFKNGEISILDGDGGSTYLVRVKNYQEGEYEEYVKRCKDAGFDDVDYETTNNGGKMFGAYDKNKEYSISVMLGNEIESISITCKKVSK